VIKKNTNIQEEKNEIKSKIITALEILYEKDLFLMKEDVNERSISHKLGEYLQILFSEFNVDCEYNRQLDENSGKQIVKRRSPQRLSPEDVKNECNKLSEKIKILIEQRFVEKIKNEENKEKTDNDILNEAQQEILQEQLKGIKIYPDIIIHKRDGNKQNVLAIEIKKTTNKDKEGLI